MPVGVPPCLLTGELPSGCWGLSNHCGHLFIGGQRAISPPDSKAHVPNRCDLHSSTFGFNSYGTAKSGILGEAFLRGFELLYKEGCMVQAKPSGLFDRSSTPVQ